MRVVDIWRVRHLVQAVVPTQSTVHFSKRGRARGRRVVDMSAAARKPGFLRGGIIDAAAAAGTAGVLEEFDLGDGGRGGFGGGFGFEVRGHVAVGEVERFGEQALGEGEEVGWVCRGVAFALGRDGRSQGGVGGEDVDGVGEEPDHRCR